ncbi:MAG: hypothetical protein OXC57_07325 [Rhodobacteraceae bacterium]|nr:hypothetical protein [Paracoccaceae bacterium]
MEALAAKYATIREQGHQLRELGDVCVELEQTIARRATRGRHCAVPTGPTMLSTIFLPVVPVIPA